MERVTPRFIRIIVILVIAGTAIALSPRAQPPIPNQEYFLNRVPRDVGEYHMVASADPGSETWKALGPDGMVENVYVGPKGRYFDFVLLAGRSSSAFHDPQICFRNQGLHFDRTFVQQLEVESLGKNIPVNVVAMTNEAGVKSSAIYFFVGPLGYDSNPLKVEAALFGAKTFGISTGQGFFFRVKHSGLAAEVP